METVTVNNLSKRYGERYAVRDVSFGVRQGEIFGLVGPNGAGKTTLVESIAGLRRPDGGEVRVLGLDPQRERAALRRVLGIQLQASQLPDRMRVWEALDLYASFYDHPADWEELIRTLGLAEKRNAPYETLSGGQKQRLSIALALVGNPQVLILDELTTGLDPEARRQMWQYVLDVRARGVTILLVTHFMEEAERLCDRIAVIHAGRLAALDTPAGLASLAGAQQRLRFRPSLPLQDELLVDLPEVRRITRRGDTVIVEGVGDLVQAVVSTLARSQIIAHDLRIEQAGLDEAFLTLTERKEER